MENVDKGLQLTSGWLETEDLKNSLIQLYMDFSEMILSKENEEYINMEKLSSELYTLRRVIEGL